MKTYTTKSGDTFDKIAFEVYGSCKFTPELIDANKNFADEFIFSAGKVLILPEVDKATKKNLPPWKT